MMFRVVLPLLLAFTLAASAPLRADDDPLAAFMQAKLSHSQQLLRGLVTEDFEGIAKNSQKLSVLSEEASWQVLQTAEYREHSLEFRRAAEAVAEAAKEKNIDGASLSYVKLTLSCIACHKYVRTVRQAGEFEGTADLLGRRESTHLVHRQGR